MAKRKVLQVKVHNDDRRSFTARWPSHFVANSGSTKAPFGSVVATSNGKHMDPCAHSGSTLSRFGSR